MDIPISPVDAIPALQPAAEQKKPLPGSKKSVGEGQQEWVPLARAILTKPLFFTRRKVHPLKQHNFYLPKKSHPTAVAMKRDPVAALKVMQSHLPKQGRGAKFSAASSPLKKESPFSAKRFMLLAHRIPFKELRQKVGELFQHKSLLQMPLKKGEATLETTRQEIPVASKEVERERCKEKIEKREEGSPKRVEGRERKKEQRETSERKGVERENERPFAALQPQRPPPEQPLLGLGPMQFAAQRLLKSPQFCAAKSVILVSSRVEKEFLTRVLKHFAGLKQLYIWTIRVDEPYGMAWSFLKRIGMPYVTLFPLNLGRKSGGWEQIRHLLFTLQALLERDLSIEEIEQDSPDKMESWLTFLEAYGVFLSAPLDFDFMLIKHYPWAYSHKKSHPLQHDLVESYYSVEERRLLPLYHALFQSDPLSAHREAWRSISSLELLENLPPVIQRLLSRLA